MKVRIAAVGAVAAVMSVIGFAAPSSAAGCVNVTIAVNGQSQTISQCV